MEDELLELWNLIQKKQDKMNRHAETCERCERQLHRYQQQLHQLSEEYNFLMSQRQIQYGQNLFEEVKNPNRARLDLAAKSAAERERYAEQREYQQRSAAASPNLIMGPGTTPFNTIFEDQVYEFGKRRSRRRSRSNKQADKKKAASKTGTAKKRSKKKVANCYRLC